MNILEIYKKYQIMPQLQEHQLRVAGVAKIICENFKGEIDSDNIIKACLLHDMGNILKFDLDNPLFQESMEPQGAEFWKKVQSEFKQKYGQDEHRAHLEIAREIGVSERILELIEAISFKGAPINAASNDFGRKICQYSDDRVGPFGVITLEQRFNDLRKRYAHHGEDSPEKRDFEQALREIEKQISAQCKIKPEDITNESINQSIEILRNYDI